MGRGRRATRHKAGHPDFQRSRPLEPASILHGAKQGLEILDREGGHHCGIDCPILGVFSAATARARSRLSTGTTMKVGWELPSGMVCTANTDMGSPGDCGQW